MVPSTVTLVIADTLPLGGLNEKSVLPPSNSSVVDASALALGSVKFFLRKSTIMSLGLIVAILITSWIYSDLLVHDF